MNTSCCTRFILLPLAIVAIATSSTAETQSTGTTEKKPTALLRLCFRDSERGTAVVPDALMVDGRLTFSRIDEAGRLDLPLESGDHMLQVNARGYQQMNAKETALVDGPPLNIITLDPLQKPAELQPAHLSRYIKPGQAIVAGFVVDDELGKPLEGVEVKTADGSAKTTSEGNGFFAVAVPMDNAGPLPEDPSQKFVKRTFVFSLEGYGREERQNVLLLKENPKFWQVRLQPGGSANVINEEDNRGGLQQWIFGVPEEHDDSTSGTGDALTTGTQH
ncbi:MAG: hypothetical protein ACR2IE_07855 [Candidatus Sumerlaeaceae bacterium]